MTIVPATALRSAERCPVNLALVTSRRPMALPTRVDAAIPALPGECFKGRIANGGRTECQLCHEARSWTGKREESAVPMPNGMVLRTEWPGGERECVGLGSNTHFGLRS